MNKMYMSSITHFNFNGMSIPANQIPNLINTFKQSKHKPEIELGSFLSDWFNDLPYIMVKTSGSTGKPKDIRLSKLCMVKSANNTLSYFNLKAGDSICLTLPCTYIAGKLMVIRALVGKLNLIMTPTTSSPFSGDTAPFSFVSLVPNQIEAFLDYERSKKVSLIKVLVGGGTISHSLLKKIQSSSSLFYQSYAMTETASHVAIRSIHGKTSTNNAYEALSGITFNTDDRNCLVIKSNYLDEPEYITNDIINLLSPTTFLWKGRFDNIINSAGIKLNPELIEHKLEPMFKDRFYIGRIDDEILGDKMILAIEGNEKLFDTNDLNVRMKKILNKHEVPKQIVFIEKFKETPTGKVLREY